MHGEPTAATVDRQVHLNEQLWAGEDLVRDYSGRTLRPAEVMLLVRYREVLAGRVLELGCGGGRLSGYLLALAREFVGLDISELMLAHCGHTYPGGTFELGDLRDLTRYANGSFDVVFASFNVLDVLDDEERRRVLGEIRRMLGDGGLLMMSSHNLAQAPSIPRPTRIGSRNPVRIVRQLLRMPRRERNRRRLLPLQRIEDDYAILTDELHEYGSLHYYIGRDAQERQLAEAGLELIECLDL
ncbi:MAG TPA: class I SAM-dependent methyltransferase, partial [Solirubrobacteraceae bacterium]|nr:class I SAM-dependent methyltransferase [Solirubrobacteraceae bacterium]